MNDGVLTEKTLNYFRSSGYLQLEVLSYCTAKKGKNSYVLEKLVTPFAEFLLKKLASVSSLVSTICLDVIKK